ncbi:hypothetical protein V8G54_023863 [Vigna mungo]|uniref:Uncharacterized protein n=1 Tax=Vigna mungo TaxID=3915 RepID=A0AAQ3N540_VIGMU
MGKLLCDLTIVVEPFQGSPPEISSFRLVLVVRPSSTVWKSNNDTTSKSSTPKVCCGSRSRNSSSSPLSSSNLRSVTSQLSHGGEVSSDRNCLFTASRKAMGLEEVDAHELQRGTVSWFSEDLRSMRFVERERGGEVVGKEGGYAIDSAVAFGDDVRTKMMFNKFFPASGTTAIRKDISGIRQLGLNNMERCMIHDVSGGALSDMTPTEEMHLIEKMASNSQHFSTINDAIVVRGIQDISKLDALVSLVTQLASNQRPTSTSVARLCGIYPSSDHYTDACPSLQQSIDCAKTNWTSSKLLRQEDAAERIEISKSRAKSKETERKLNTEDELDFDRWKTKEMEEEYGFVKKSTLTGGNGADMADLWLETMKTRLRGRNPSRGFFKMESNENEMCVSTWKGSQMKDVWNADAMKR